MNNLEDVKKHIANHKRAYKIAAISVGVVSLVGVGYVLGRKTVPNHVETLVAPRQTLNWKPLQTVEVHVEALGDPGNIIQDVTTGTIYASQGQAARELGLTPSRISEQLKGVRDTVNGHQFINLGKAHVLGAPAK